MSCEFHTHIQVCIPVYYNAYPDLTFGCHLIRISLLPGYISKQDQQTSPNPFKPLFVLARQLIWFPEERKICHF